LILCYLNHTVCRCGYCIINMQSALCIIHYNCHLFAYKHSLSLHKTAFPFNFCHQSDCIFSLRGENRSSKYMHPRQYWMECYLPFFRIVVDKTKKKYIHFWPFMNLLLMVSLNRIKIMVLLKH